MATSYHESECSCRTTHVPVEAAGTSIFFPKPNPLNSRVLWAKVPTGIVFRHGIQGVLLSLKSTGPHSRVSDILKEIPALAVADQDLEFQVRMFVEQCRGKMASAADPHQKCMYGLTCLSLAAYLRGNRIRVPWALEGIISAWAEPCYEDRFGLAAEEAELVTTLLATGSA